MTRVLAGTEDLQARIRAYLDAADRSGDVDRIAQRIALRHSRGSRVVGLRRDGRELFAYDAARNELEIYQVERDGKLSPIGTVWRGKEVEPWLDEHSFYLDWIAPEWR